MLIKDLLGLKPSFRYAWFRFYAQARERERERDVRKRGDLARVLTEGIV
jgi:hypothetical protein